VDDDELQQADGPRTVVALSVVLVQEDRGRYESEEQEAKGRTRGLWADREPVPPWEWRRRKN